MILAKQLYKSFSTANGVVHAVSDMSFAAKDGQITGLLGPNGAGKTTTLRMLYTLARPDQGAVVVDGIDVARDKEGARNRLGVLPDARGIYTRLTARENIEFFGQVYGLDATTIRKRTEQLADDLGLTEVLDRRTEGFSQGERTKTALARALIHNPQNIILDEPTNGLDVMTTRGLRSYLKRLREQGRCIIFSSHIMQEVAALCDYIVVVARGTVVAAGTPNALREQTKEASIEDAFVKLIASNEMEPV